MSSCQHGVKESAVMKSEASKNKEIDECVKELDGWYDKLYKRYCEGKICIGCPIGEQDCLLTTLEDLIEELKEKNYELLQTICGNVRTRA